MVTAPSPVSTYVCRICAQWCALDALDGVAPLENLLCPACHSPGALAPTSTRPPDQARGPRPTRRAPDAMRTYGLLAAGGVAAVVLAKLAQAAFDETFDSIEFPRRTRHELIDAHVERHGAHCKSCNTRTARADLQVDHIVALKNGGRTSRANARVICRWCNARKGGRNRLADYLRGRTA